MFLQIMGYYKQILIFPILIKAFPCFQSPLVNLWPSCFNPYIAGMTDACHYPSHSAFIIKGHMHIGGLILWSHKFKRRTSLHTNPSYHESGVHEH